jgi:catechol 2,3-dioxygenase-like lactoylglutathione lyase family enzyme
MIEVNEIIAWSGAGRSEHAECGGILELHMTVRNLRRSVDFYRRVFGFRVSGALSDRNSAVVTATARADLVIHEQSDATCAETPALRRWAFVVTDLDNVRQAVWELGVNVARDSGDPDHIYRWANGRSLYVRDPDDNEIELVEIWSYAVGALTALRTGQCAPTVPAASGV